jgi:hypothetical protein
MSELGLPGDTFDIDLDANIMTHPTLGPLFGSYKVQLDVFEVPIRLYNGDLHNNTLGIGLDMSKVKLPQLVLEAKNPDLKKPIDNQQINPSSIFKYLGISGLGRNGSTGETVTRRFNAVPYLGYWDIYKNYYANKQEEVGAVIHTDSVVLTETVSGIGLTNNDGISWIVIPENIGNANAQITENTRVDINYTGTAPKIEEIKFKVNNVLRFTSELFREINDVGGTIKCSSPNERVIGQLMDYWQYETQTQLLDSNPKINFFPLSNIDDARNVILRNTGLGTPVIVGAGNDDEINFAPYSLACGEEDGVYYKLSSQEGLGLKTYQKIGRAHV